MKLNFTVCSSRRHSSRPAANVAMYIERLNWCCSTKSRHIDKRMWMKWNKYLRYQLEICDFNFNSQCTRFKFSHLIFIQFGWCNRKWQKGKMGKWIRIHICIARIFYLFIHSFLFLFLYKKPSENDSAVNAEEVFLRQSVIHSSIPWNIKFLFFSHKSLKYDLRNSDDALVLWIMHFSRIHSFIHSFSLQLCRSLHDLISARIMGLKESGLCVRPLHVAGTGELRFSWLLSSVMPSGVAGGGRKSKILYAANETKRYLFSLFTDFAAKDNTLPQRLSDAAVAAIVHMLITRTRSLSIAWQCLWRTRAHECPGHGFGAAHSVGWWFCRGRVESARWSFIQ